LLAESWSGVLKVDRVGIHDNFFELGGHSLSAMQVIARLRAQLDTDITVASFFELPTVAEFALQLASQMTRETNGEDGPAGDDSTTQILNGTNAATAGRLDRVTTYQK
jgi:acyl carrier protein